MINHFDQFHELTDQFSSVSMTVTLKCELQVVKCLYKVIPVRNCDVWKCVKDIKVII